MALLHSLYQKSPDNPLWLGYGFYNKIDYIQTLRLLEASGIFSLRVAYFCQEFVVHSHNFLGFFSNFIERCRKFLTRTRKFADSTTFLNDVQNEIFDSTSLSKRDRNFLHQHKLLRNTIK